MNRSWVVSSSPHIRSETTTSGIMWRVTAALAPAGAWSVFLFGFAAIRLAILSVAAALITEYAIQRFRRIKVTIADGSAFLTGLLVAYVLPVYVPGVEGDFRPIPAFVPITASFVAIAIAKQAFGGLGFNIWNPALVGRAFVQVAWPQHVSLSQWVWLRGAETDAVTSATALANFKTTGDFGFELGDMFAGMIPGSMGEMSALLLIAGGIYLIVRDFIDWRLPISFIAMVFIGGTLAGAFGETSMSPMGVGLGYLLAGGLMLGAFFMATDMVTSPLTRKGQIIFGLGAGVLTVLFRLFTGAPEGVCYAILIMNMATPIIDRHTKPAVYGSRHSKAEEEKK